MISDIIMLKKREDSHKKISLGGVSSWVFFSEGHKSTEIKEVNVPAKWEHTFESILILLSLRASKFPGWLSKVHKGIKCKYTCTLILLNSV